MIPGQSNSPSGSERSSEEEEMLTEEEEEINTEEEEETMPSCPQVAWSYFFHPKEPEPVDPVLNKLSGGLFQHPDLKALRDSINAFIGEKANKPDYNSGYYVPEGVEADWEAVARYIFDVLRPTSSVYKLVECGSISELNPEMNGYLKDYGEEVMDQCQDLYDELVSKLDPVKFRLYLKRLDINHAITCYNGCAGYCCGYEKDPEREAYWAEIIRHCLDDITDEASLNEFLSELSLSRLEGDYDESELNDEGIDLYHEMQNKITELRKKFRNHG
jgi:hypothetical protein